MGVVLAVELVPTALLGILSGTLVSRLGARADDADRRRRTRAAPAGIPVLHAAGVLTFTLLLACRVRHRGSSAPPTSPHSGSSCPSSSVTKSGRSRRLTPSSRALSSDGLLAPAIAGVLIAAIGAANVLYIDAGTFLFSFLVLSFLVPRRPPIEAHESGGVARRPTFLLRDPLLAQLLGISLVLNMFGMALAVSLPVLAYEGYDHDSRLAGAFFAGYGWAPSPAASSRSTSSRASTPYGWPRWRSSRSRCRSGCWPSSCRRRRSSPCSSSRPSRARS